MPDTKIDENQELARTAHTLVFRVAHDSFGGVLPEDRAAVVASILAILPKNTRADQLEEITPHLLHAVREYQRMQHCQFQL